METQVQQPQEKHKKCPNCGQNWIPPTGLSSIFRMPTGNEWTILIMLCGVLLMSYAYLHDTNECRKFFSDPSQICARCVEMYKALGPDMKWNSSSNSSLFIQNMTLPLGQVKNAQNKS